MTTLPVVPFSTEGLTFTSLVLKDCTGYYEVAACAGKVAGTDVVVLLPYSELRAHRFTETLTLWATYAGVNPAASGLLSAVTII
jgi:hypothetical protein